MTEIIKNISAFAGLPMAVLISIVFLSCTIYLTTKVPPCMHNQTKALENNNILIGQLIETSKVNNTAITALSKDISIMDRNIVSTQADVKYIKENAAMKQDIILLIGGKKIE
jgi:hypothetical protein